MPNITPTQLFQGYALLAEDDAAPAQGIFIPLTAFAGGGGDLSPEMANATTGDGRKVVYEIVETVNRAVAGMQASDRPTYMKIARTEARSRAADSVVRKFTFDFEEQITATQLRPEA